MARVTASVCVMTRLAFFGYGVLVASIAWAVFCLCNARAAKREDREAGIRELVKKNRLV